MSLVLVLVLMMPSGGFAQNLLFSDISLRLQGLGTGFAGVIEDEYTDLFLNPANINKIDGNRLYTNLSNIQEGTPYLTLQNSDVTAGSADGKTTYNHTATSGANGLGFVTNLFGNNVGILFGQRAVSTDNTTSGSRDDKSSGTNEYNYSWKNEDTSKNNFTEAMVFLGRKLSDTLSVGANLSLGLINSEDVIPLGSVTPPWGLPNVPFSHYEGKTILLSTGQQTGNETRDNFQNIMQKQQMVKAQAGANLAMGDFGVSLSGTVQPLSMDSSAKTTNNTAITTSGTTKDFTTTETTSKGSGNLIGVNGKVTLPSALVKDFAKVYAFGGFNTYSVPITGEATTTVYYDNATVVNGNGYLFEDSKSVTPTTGKESDTAFNVGLGSEKELSESTKLFMGVKFQNDNWVSENTNDVNKKTGSAKDALGASVTINQTGNTKTGNKVEETTTSIRVPVGIESKVLPKLTLRLGAEAVLYSKHTGKNTTTTTDTTPYKVVSTTNPYNGTTSQTSSSYTIGAGYELNEKVQIDLLNFGELTKPSTWAIGATVKF